MDYDVVKLKGLISIEQVFEILEEYGGEPEYDSDDVIISRTICHNHPHNDASRKLYYYHNGGSGLFHCYTSCPEPSFDIFELIIKIADIQFHQEWSLVKAIKFLLYKLGISIPDDDDEAVVKELEEDYKLFDRYDKIKNIDLKNYTTEFKGYDDIILSRFNYKVKLTPWLNEGISQKTIDQFKIGFFPGNDVITIPHYDINGNFIGLRGRALCREDAERFGKYRPIRANGVLYNHPLGYNLYGLNLNKEAIKNIGKAIVYEGEKSVLLHNSYFGEDNNISVACCGSNFSIYQYFLLKNLGVNEIIIAFDRQFKDIGDAEWEKWTKKLKEINKRFNKYTQISFMFDKTGLLGYKESPIDKGPDVFMELFKNRIIL